MSRITRRLSILRQKKIIITNKCVKKEGILYPLFLRLRVFHFPDHVFSY